MYFIRNFKTKYNKDKTIWYYNVSHIIPNRHLNRWLFHYGNGNIINAEMRTIEHHIQLHKNNDF